LHAQLKKILMSEKWQHNFKNAKWIIMLILSVFSEIHFFYIDRSLDIA
jgi:hypothetical protein